MHGSVWIAADALTSRSVVVSDSPGEAPGLRCPDDALVYEWDLRSDRLAWSGDVGRIFAALPADAPDSGERFAQLVVGDSGDSRLLAMLGNPPDGDGRGSPYRALYSMRRRAGAPIVVEDCGRMFADGRGRPLLARGLIRAIDGLGRSPGALNHDRADFLREVDATLRLRRGPARPFALLIVAIEVASDQGLPRQTSMAGEAIPRALRRGLRYGDRAVWIARGRYALFLRADRAQATTFARRLARALAEDGVRSRVGIALADREEDGAHVLVERAQGALATAPRRVVAVHSPSRLARFRRLAIDAARDEIVGALNDRRIGLARRPSLALREAAPPLAEGLVCLQRQEGGILGPLDLRSAVVGSEVADLLDVRLLELALAALRGEPRLRLTIAPSSGDAPSPAWLGRLEAATAGSPSIAARLVVGFRLFGVPRLAGPWLDAALRVKALDLRLAVDDFSASPEVLPSLRRLGVDLVKIDGSRMQNLARSIADRAYLKEVVGAARQSGMATLAKGADDPETLNQLRSLGVDFAQGGGFEPPRPQAPAFDGQARRGGEAPDVGEPCDFAALSPYSPAYRAASASR